MEKNDKHDTAAHSEDLSKSRPKGRKPTTSAKRTWTQQEALEILQQTISNAQDAGLTIVPIQASEDVSPGKPLVSVLIYGVTWDAEARAFSLADAEERGE